MMIFYLSQVGNTISFGIRNGSHMKETCSNRIHFQLWNPCWKIIHPITSNQIISLHVTDDEM